MRWPALILVVSTIGCSGSPTMPRQWSLSAPTSGATPPPTNHAQLTQTVSLFEPEFRSHVDLGSSPIAGVWTASCDASVRHDVTLTIVEVTSGTTITMSSARSVAGPFVEWSGQVGESYRAIVTEGGGTPLEPLSLRVTALVPEPAR
jgi:hypothetical protein